MVNKGSVRRYFLCAVAIVNSATNGYDGSMMNGLQSLSTWRAYFNSPSASTLGLLNDIRSIGGLVGIFIAPSTSDRLGRKLTIFIGSVIMILGVALQSASMNINMFLAARFLLGFGGAFTSNATPMILAEIAPSKHRGKITSMYMTMWYLGSIIAAWTAFGTSKIPNEWSWRIPSLLQGLPSIVQIAAVWMYEESPRWLIAKGRNEEALKILANFHADGNLLDHEVQKQYIEIKESIRREQEVSKQTNLQLFATPGNRRRIFICIFAGLSAAWSGNVHTHNFFNQRNASNMEFDLGLMCCFAGGQSWSQTVMESINNWHADVFRYTTICTAVYSIHGSVAAGYASIINIFLLFASYDIAMTPLVIAYPVEILTFTIRAKGRRLYGMINGLAVFITIYVNSIAFDAIGWKLYIVYCGWLALEVIIV
ncbi:unnamed protein product [Umbelopsis vinacea]